MLYRYLKLFIFSPTLILEHNPKTTTINLQYVFNWIIWVIIEPDYNITFFSVQIQFNSHVRGHLKRANPCTAFFMFPLWLCQNGSDHICAVMDNNMLKMNVIISYKMVFKFKIPYLMLSKQFWLQKSIYGCFIEPQNQYTNHWSQ